MFADLTVGGQDHAVFAWLRVADRVAGPILRGGAAAPETSTAAAATASLFGLCT
jgi:hypothetical protein